MKRLLFILITIIGIRGHCQVIEGIEYSIDQFVEQGSGTWLPVEGELTEVGENLNIDISGLNEGMHVVYLRSKNSDGVWSLPLQQTFYVGPRKSSPNIVGIEYSIDEFVSDGKGTWLSIDENSTDFSSEIEIDITGLDQGSHTIWFRSKNKSGAWSSPSSSSFYVSKPDQTKITGIYSRIIDKEGTGDWQFSPIYPQRKMVDTLINVSTESLNHSEKYTLEFYAVNNKNLRGYSAFLMDQSFSINNAPELLKTEESISLDEKAIETINMNTLFTDKNIVAGDSLTYQILGTSPASVEEFLGWSKHDMLEISPWIGDEGSYSFTIKATDLAGESVSIPVTVTVLPAQTSENNAPELLKTKESISLYEEALETLDMTTLFTDKDLDSGDKLDYQILNASPSSVEDFLDWKDDETLEIAPNVGDEGSYNFIIKATDLAGESVSIPVSLKVSPLETSVNSVLTGSAFMVYPNPANDYLNIENISGDQQTYNLKLYNLQGQLLKSVFVTDPLYRLGLYEYTIGIYLLEMQLDQNSIQKRIIIE